MDLKADDGNLIIALISKLFKGFYNVLSTQPFDTVLLCNNTLLLYLSNYDPDMEIQFANLLPLYGKLLGSPKYPVHTSTFKVLKAYILQSKNIESVLVAISREGMYNSEWNVR